MAISAGDGETGCQSLPRRHSLFLFRQESVSSSFSFFFPPILPFIRPSNRSRGWGSLLRKVLLTIVSDRGEGFLLLVTIPWIFRV